jgi:hypothetical protein
MAYTKQLSPAVQIREIDLTNFVPTMGASGGAFVGQFLWGPVKEYRVINDVNTLMKTFGKPADNNYVDWFSAANFLSYNDNLKLVRIVDTTSISPALNSTVDGSGMRVDNKDHFQTLINSGFGTSEEFVARYPGILGDSLKVSLADSATFSTWIYKDEFDFAPGTSQFAKNLGASNDEVHVVVVDEDGKFTGSPGAVIEKYAFLSKALNCKGLDNEPNFYGNVINNSSSYVWYFSPVKGGIDLDIENSIQAVVLGSAGTGYGKPVITFVDTITEGNPGGMGASAKATLDADGKITDIALINKGSGYSATVTVTITDSGSGASAKAIVANGVITSILAVDTGKDYYTANVAISEGATGAHATAVLAATGSIKTAVLAAPGTGYAAAEVLTIAGGTGGTFIVDTVDGSGVILTGHAGVAGSGYSAGATGAATTSSGAGTGATITTTVGKAVATVNVTAAGSGYGTTNAAFAGGGGTGATGTVTVGTSGVNKGKVTAVAITSGGSGYTTAPTVSFTGAGTGAVAAAVLGTVGTPNEGRVIGYTVSNGGTGYGTPIITVTPGGSGATATATVLANDEAATNWGQNCATALGVPVTFFSLQNVSEGAYSKNLGGGADGQDVSAADIIQGWNLYQNAEEIDVGLLFVGDGGGSATSKVVIRHVIDNIAEYRRDCMVFLSPNLVDVLNQDQVSAARNVKSFVQDPILGINRGTSFAVCDSGWKLQYDVFNDKYRWIPLNPDIAGLCAQTETDYDAWWSPAGLTRGKIKNVVSLAFNPNKSSRDELYRANVNSVVSFTGEGVLLYGDKTLQTKNSAFSFINVRRLFIVLEKSIGKSAKQMLFEFNDAFTRNQFLGMVEPYLRNVQARRGIYDFKVICDESNNPPEVIDRAEFIASIFIKPARSINYITLNFVAVRTGVEFSEVVGVV